MGEKWVLPEASEEAASARGNMGFGRVVLRSYLMANFVAD
jgi:hypothetical protein